MHLSGAHDGTTDHGLYKCMDSSLDTISRGEAIIMYPLLVILLSVTVIQSSYVKDKQCNEPSSLYEYTLSGEMHDKRAKEVAVTTCSVVLHCMSEGTFNGVDQATHYCIKLDNVIQKMIEVKINQVTMTQTKYLKESTDMTEDMKNDFCFLRSKDGSLLKILHPRNEKTEIVNFKKAIVSAFQANFAKTKSKVETDVQSKHKSHYKYESRGSNTVEHRTVNSEDVSKYSGTAKKKGVDYHSEEDVEVDGKKTIRRAHGESTTSLTRENKQEEKVEGKNSDIPPIEVKSEYTLKLIKRLSPSVNVMDDDPMVLEVDNEATVMDDIMAQYDEYEDDMADMEELDDEVTDIEEMASRMTRSVDSNTTKHIEDHARALQKWRQLLHLESKHGPMKGRKPKMQSIIDKLKKVWFDDTEHSSNLRMIIYDLLSNEGSTAAQQALMNSLRIKQMTDHNEEYNSIVSAIGLLETIELPSLVDFKQYVLANGSSDDQLLLSLATLGRHKNVEQEVVDTITGLIEDQGVNNTDTLIYFIHALGNTGSKLIIPHLTPLLLNEDLQVTVIDALRTVSTDKRVQIMFTDLCDSTSEVSTVLAIIDSIRFPYESFLYYPDPPEQPEDKQVEQQLLMSIINATIRIQDETLYNATIKYLHAVKTEFSSILLNELITEYDSSNSTHRSKRSYTSNWAANSSPSYNHVAGVSSRIADKNNYEYHKAFLWGKRLGPSKVHVNFAAGGFAGVGHSGYKTYGKVFVQAYCFGKTYTALDGQYLTTYNFRTKAKEVKRYMKILGVTYIDSSATTQARVRLPYYRTWSKSLWSRRLFYVQYRIPIWIGVLKFYLQGDVTVDSRLTINMKTTGANANLQVGPTFVITGGVSYTLLFKYRVGISVQGRLGYYLKPQASVTLCDTAPRADVSTCFGIFHGSSGLKVNVNAYYKIRRCRIRRWRPRCWWSNPRTIGRLSSSFTMGSESKRLLWGKCKACSCGHPLRWYCSTRRGSPSGASGCYCRSTTFQ